MLDDLKYIHDRDADDALGIVEKQPQQLLDTYELRGSTNFSDINNVVYAGMGGSALAALLVHTWPSLNLPFEVVRDYDLPGYVDTNTLVIVASYSGNTEEALSALEQAEARQAKIAVIAGGGALHEAAESRGYLLGMLPKVVQPRYAVLANYKLILQILVSAGLAGQNQLDELIAASAFLQESVVAWNPTIRTHENPAKQLALECIGKSVVIYAGSKLAPAAYKWKIGFNENGKQVAWTGQYPEFNHNEFLGWSKQPVDKPYTVIDLRSSFEHERTQKRFTVSERLLSGMRPSPEIVAVQGDTLLQQLLWTLAYGDFVTIYTGIASGLNPAPVELVEKFKKEMI
jgi:glucose/mannose-6-phosphate isomerase